MKKKILNAHYREEEKKNKVNWSKINNCNNNNNILKNEKNKLNDLYLNNEENEKRNLIDQNQKLKKNYSAVEIISNEKFNKLPKIN